LFYKALSPRPILTIQFCGAARTVTGSQYYFEYTSTSGKAFRFCLESGMFQVGQKANLHKVNSHLLFDPRKLDCIVLTHAHLDHCGRIPYLVKRGFGGRIYSTKATMKIAEVVLRDAAILNSTDSKNPDYYFPVKGLRKKEITDTEEKFRSRQVAQKISPEDLGTDSYGLYDTADVETAMSRFRTYEYHQKFKIHDEIEVEFFDAGHILGSAYVCFHFLKTGKKLVFSGDLGNTGKPIIQDPEMPHKLEDVSHVIVETTYGDRLHGKKEPKTKLKDICGKALRKGGQVFIPSFSVERAQEVIYFLVELMRSGKLPQVPIFLDSPMAQKVLQITLEHPELYDESMHDKITHKAHPLIYGQLKILETSDDSKLLNDYKKPCIVIAGSGMLNGGRIMKHARFHLKNPKNTFIMVGYQAEGTLGRKIWDGAKVVEIDYQEVEVKAAIEMVSEFSGHADRKILKEWVSSMLMASPQVPTTVFLTHGEKRSSLAFGEEIKYNFPGDNVVTHWPYFGEKVELF
jgi:metallo-beta-lactamase family protein